MSTAPTVTPGHPVREGAGYDCHCGECQARAHTTPPPCGTYAAYQRHYKRGQPIDQECRDANRRYMADWRARNGEAQRRDRNLNRARSRALEALGRAHPFELNRLMHAELAEIEQEHADDR